MERGDLSANLQTREGLPGQPVSPRRSHVAGRSIPPARAAVRRGDAGTRGLPVRDEPHRLAVQDRDRRRLRPQPRERLAAGRDDARPRAGGVRHPHREPVVPLQRRPRRRVRAPLRAPSQAPEPGGSVLSEDVVWRDHEPVDQRPAAGPDAPGLRRPQRRQRRLRVRERASGHAPVEPPLTLACLVTCRWSSSSRARFREGCSTACARTRPLSVA